VEWKLPAKGGGAEAAAKAMEKSATESMAFFESSS